MRGLFCFVISVASVLCAPDTRLYSQQTPHTQSRTATTMQPDAVVTGLYDEVVARHPLGISINKDVFAPYLSSALAHRIEVANACLDDWYRQNPDRRAKPPGLEGGLFTGDDLRAEPQAFHIEKVQAEKDGSIRAYIELRHDEPSESWTWRIAAILVRENDRFVVDDVIYLKDRPRDVEVRLSQYLLQGCDGTHWVGHRDKQ